LQKGYYTSEKELVEKIKRAVLGDQLYKTFDGKFKTIEMQIMDIADDIAYSTYDFEDALKAGFGSPLELLSEVNKNSEIRHLVAKKIFKSSTDRVFPESPSPDDNETIGDIEQNIVRSLLGMFAEYFYAVDREITEDHKKKLLGKDKDNRALIINEIAIHLQAMSDKISRNGYVRSLFTSDLIGRRIRAVDIELNTDYPVLSEVKVDRETRFEIDVLKHLTYELHVKSPRLKMIEYRGRQIVEHLFDCLHEDKEGELLPYDWRARVETTRHFKNSEAYRSRLICDYIAGMTDSYAVDVYARLMTANQATLFKPF
jgi:dGTPase